MLWVPAMTTDCSDSDAAIKQKYGACFCGACRKILSPWCGLCDYLAQHKHYSQETTDMMRYLQPQLGL